MLLIKFKFGRFFQIYEAFSEYMNFKNKLPAWIKKTLRRPYGASQHKQAAYTKGG